MNAPRCGYSFFPAYLVVHSQPRGLCIYSLRRLLLPVVRKEINMILIRAHIALIQYPH